MLTLSRIRVDAFEGEPDRIAAFPQIEGFAASRRTHPATSFRRRRAQCTTKLIIIFYCTLVNLSICLKSYLQSHLDRGIIIRLTEASVGTMIRLQAGYNRRETP